MIRKSAAQKLDIDDIMVFGKQNMLNLKLWLKDLNTFRQGQIKL